VVQVVVVMEVETVRALQVILPQQHQVKVFLVDVVNLFQLIEVEEAVVVQLLQEEMPHLLNKLEMVELEQQQVFQEVP
jgi:hypothetical protein